MGLDLTLMPVIGEFVCAHEMVDVRDTAAYDDIEALDGIKLYKPISTFRGRLDDGDSGYGPTLDTPYGERIEHVSAAELDQIGMDCPAGAFVSKLAPDTRVLLYWH